MTNKYRVTTVARLYKTVEDSCRQEFPNEKV